AGDTLLDRRIETDPERFWDALQTDVYGRIVEYVMDIQDGEPSGSNAPYFDELSIQLRMSEPNRRIGVDQEVISSLEALHEDIYFETLTLFDLIGNRYGVGGLAYPGRVLPYIDPTGAGQPGTATVTLTGKEHGVPRLVAVAERDGMEPERREYALQPLPVPEPPLRGVSVRADGAGDDDASRSADGSRAGSRSASPAPLASLLFEVEVVDSLDRYDEYRERSSEGAIDRTFLSAELLEGMLSALERMHGDGLFTETFAWDRVDRTDVLFRVEDDSTWARVRSISRSDAPLTTDARELLAEGWTWDGQPMVQWETPIPPAGNDSILARLNTFPGVDVYHVTRSFLGQPVWAVDLLPPQPATYVSQATLNARKPTLFISGRQHANEVSSTSHILRLAELLATDSTYRSYLDDVNVVLHPITNPDGARLAVEMQETNPDFMLHAGYLGALGVDATAGERDSDPIYPESQARRRLRETWLPDAYVNMHGYPSHEWVQYFAGYSAWVRSRRGGARDWWAPRGWFVPGFRWVDDDENPEYTEAQMAMLDSVAASIRGVPDVAAMSDRLYARYRKYGREDREGFREHFRGDVLMYLSLRGAESIGQGVYSPRITYFATTTEAPDETARGDWLELVASAGLAHASALLRYLAEGEFEVERQAEAVEGGVVRKAYRVKPVLPPEDGEPEGGAAEEGTPEEGEAAGGGG
ncbi:MAG: M14 family metallopeptidase, partial [Gemmatimonadota bacterium]